MKSRKIIIVIFIIVVWAGLSRIVKPIFLPSPIDVADSLISVLFSDGLKDIFFTLKRTILAFFFGSVIAIPLGVFLGSFKKVYDSIEFLVDFLRSIPVSAMFPLFLIFFGFGDASKITMGAWASGIIIMINTIYGVRNTKKNRRIMALTKGATPFQILTKITLPEATPYIFAGMRIGISWNLIVVIVAEMIIGTFHGLGHLIYDASIVFDTPSVFAGIIIIGLIGYTMNHLVLSFERRIVHWKGYS